jgi:hypothetical protein
MFCDRRYAQARVFEKVGTSFVRPKRISRFPFRDDADSREGAGGSSV